MIWQWAITFWAGNNGAALIGPLFDLAVLADGLGERADLEEAHEHRVVTGAVEARLVGDDTVTFAVVLEHVVTSCTALRAKAKHTHTQKINENQELDI